MSAKQFESNGLGMETEVPLDTWFTIAVFPESTQEIVEQTPLFAEKRRLHSGVQTLVVRVPVRPGAVGVDPFHVMIDRTPGDNIRRLTP
ncbi:MAG: hypothetical protein QM736_00410 [Vicinamibacterales bacterium]